MPRIEINDIPLDAEENATIVHAARELDISIPTLCHLDLEAFRVEHRSGSCRICMVEVEFPGGKKQVMPACSTTVSEGMKITTNSAELIQIRRTVLELLLSDHPFECLTCEKSLDCELQALARQFGIISLSYTGKSSSYPVDISSNAIKRNLDKCIMCRRCETACNEIQTVGVLSGHGRGFGAVVAPAEMKPLDMTVCVFCGQCVNACPTAALTEINYVQEVWRALSDPSKTVICQTAPAVRVGIGQEFDIPAEEIISGRLVAALKKLGFDGVFDTNFGADLTIMEEAHEIVDRISSGHDLPILTSCCPGWINFLEYQFPDLINIPSTCKSPQQMFGTIAKTYYADKTGVRPEDLIVVSIMPCLAKKYEASRPEFTHDGVPEVDYVLSTRELSRMLREAGINLALLKDRDYDDPMGESSGAADIFAVTGGVLEAALRTACSLISGKELGRVDFNDVRGFEGIKEAEIDIEGTKLKVAASSGLGNARELLRRIQSGENTYHVIEIMACPGGCINGGGQPYIHGDTDILRKRMETIYRIDSEKKLRRSHENPSIQRLYREFLGEPGGKKSHELLHTSYYRKAEISTDH